MVERDDEEHTAETIGEGTEESTENHDEAASSNWDLAAEVVRQEGTVR